MAIGDSISQPIPAVGTPGTTYASQLVAFLQEVKARLEAKVPLSSVLASLLDMDNNGVSNAQYVGLYEQTSSPVSPVGALYNYQGNLWYVSASGAAQITAGNSLNAASLGAIGGDYGGANPASVRFVDVDETYYFYDDYAQSHWGRLAGRSLDVYGTLDETERVRITWGGGSNWTLTLPGSPPVSGTTFVQVDDSGQLSFSNSADHDLEFTADHHIKLTGNGKYKHGEYKIIQPLAFADFFATGTLNFTTGMAGAIVPSGVVAWARVQGLPSHARIRSITVHNDAAPASTVSYTLAGLSTASAIPSFVPGTTVSSGSQSATISGTFDLTPDITYLVAISPSSSSVHPHMLVITYDVV